MAVNNVERRLDVVDPAPVPVVAPANQNAQLLICPEALADRTVDVIGIAAAFDGVMAAVSVQIERRFLLGSLRYQVHRAADGISVLVRRKRLVEFNGIHQVGGNHIQLDLAHIALGRRHAYAIDRYIAQARFQAADLHIFAFALVTLQGDAGHAAQGVGDVGIRQAGDDLDRQDLKNIVGGARAVNRLRFAVDTFRRDQYFFGLGPDFQRGI